MLRKGSPPPTGHVSYVMCPMSLVTFCIYFLDKVVKVVGGESVINGATPSSLIKHNFFHVHDYALLFFLLLF